jgi:hypothetical protein
MRMQRIAITLSMLNVALLVWMVAPSGSTHAQTPARVLRGEAIELVDRDGQVRAAMTVESNGEAVLRLRDAKGTIRVKLGASEEGSALLLLDGLTEPGVHVLSRRTGTTFTIKGPDGDMHEIKPARRKQ